MSLLTAIDLSCQGLSSEYSAVSFSPRLSHPRFQRETRGQRKSSRGPGDGLGQGLVQYSHLGEALWGRTWWYEWWYEGVRRVFELWMAAGDS